MVKNMESIVENVPGAAIFWLYIVAALAFTIAAIWTISNIKFDAQAEDAAGKRRDGYVFVALAFASFALLSFNMLRILVHLYQAWSAVRSYPMLSYSDQPDAILARLWEWSTTSTPFNDFGRAIASDEFGWLWSQSALMKTFSVCLYMAYEAPRLGVPNLWVFLGLAEILPTSFALNLFYLAQSRLPPQKLSRTSFSVKSQYF